MPTEELDLYLDDAFMGDNEILCYMKHEDVFFLDNPHATFWAWRRGLPLFTRSWDDVLVALDYADKKWDRLFAVTFDDADMDSKMTQLHYKAAIAGLELT
jgi:hypothetical protein